jgi:maleate isomerase
MKRLGVLTPSSNTVLEPATSSLLAPLADHVSTHFARFRVTEVADDPASHRQFELEPMLAAAGLLADAGVDAILWAGTSGSWRGLDADERLVHGIADSTGIPATTATLALVDAFRELDVRRYALVVPYVAAITDAIVEVLGGAGWSCVATSSESLTVNRQFADVSSDAIVAAVRRVARTRPDAVAIHCTNLRGWEVAHALERELDIPVLDSVVVGLWGVLRILGLHVPGNRFGRLAAIGPAATEARVGAGG